MLRKLFERRRIKRTLGNCLDEEGIEAILRYPSEPLAFRTAHVEFVLVFIDGEDPIQVSDRIARVTTLVYERGAIVQDIVGALVVATFGTLKCNSKEPADRFSLVHALVKEMGATIKIVHGASDGHCGIVGGEQLMFVTFLIPEFDQVLAMVGALNFGECQEYGN